jgi:hypothetical protein
MYKVKFSKEVSAKIVYDLLSKIKNRECWFLPRVKEIEFSTLEVWKNVISILEQEPYCYPEYSKNIFMAIELYLPFVLFYTIENENVHIFKAALRDEIY